MQGGREKLRKRRLRRAKLVLTGKVMHVATVALT